MKAGPIQPTRIAWNPPDYAANSGSQHRWARELIAKASLAGDEKILDVGCGDGKVSAELARAVPRGAVVGIDASEEMIRFAKEAFPQNTFPNLEFHLMDARRIRFLRRFDLVFSNASLHWVDDHPAFLRGAAVVLRPGGRLLVSCGGKGNAHDVFEALRAEMRTAQWREFFRKLQKPYFFYSPENYARWLPQAGFAVRSVQLVPKDALHENESALAAWLRTTWLPYTLRVPDASRQQFINTVVERYLAKHPPDEQGRICVRMVRLEIDAIKL